MPCHLSYVCFTACKLKSSLVKTMQWNNTLHNLVLVLVKCEFECVSFATRALLKVCQNAFVCLSVCMLVWYYCTVSQGPVLTEIIIIINNGKWCQRVSKKIYILTLTFSVLWLVPLVNPTICNGSWIKDFKRVVFV